MLPLFILPISNPFMKWPVLCNSIVRYSMLETKLSKIVRKRNPSLSMITGLSLIISINVCTGNRYPCNVSLRIHIEHAFWTNCLWRIVTTMLQILWVLITWDAIRDVTVYLESMVMVTIVSMVLILAARLIQVTIMIVFLVLVTILIVFLVLVTMLISIVAVPLVLVSILVLSLVLVPVSVVTASLVLVLVPVISLITGCSVPLAIPLVIRLFAMFSEH